jgi:hypothetical protein
VDGAKDSSRTIGGMHFRMHMLTKPHKVEDSSKAHHARAIGTTAGTNSSSYHRRGFCTDCTPGFFGQCQKEAAAKGRLAGECVAIVGVRQCPYRFRRCFNVPPYHLRYQVKWMSKHVITNVPSTQTH